MNEPREIGSYEIVSSLDGSVTVMKDGQGLARFLSMQQAEAWLLLKLNQMPGWCERGLEQFINPQRDEEVC